MAVNPLGGQSAWRSTCLAVNRHGDEPARQSITNQLTI